MECNFKTGWRDTSQQTQDSPYYILAVKSADLGLNSTSEIWRAA